MKIKKICKQCGKEFEIEKKYISERERKTCSKECQFKLMSKNTDYKLIRKSGHGNPFYGKKHSKETIKKMQLAKKGKTWEEIYGRGYAEKKREQLKSISKNRIRTEEERKKLSEALKGRKLSKESIEKMRQTKINGFKVGKYKLTKTFGLIPWNKNKKNAYSENTINKMSKSQRIRFLNPIVLAEHAKEQRRRFRNDDFLFNYFMGKMFGKNYKPNKLDKEIIRTRVRLFKIHHKEVTHETGRL